ncbi:hypothetical protein HYPBUDRAFT_151751 [Hyphopichia burtonii NRRL Y-1933]|uniref:Protein YIP n=1 Tax=Hyphopichia burtonii NRRL Y-1933 TaxID=984485 RepID=A0A1E4RT72_9ASCO|nr:hypothetical protein HYPBUDRAFT_151751 [Hyphopichia burtonii NRRL Y-1933]ODV70411.1 hypothetical protein HYPBUDRAFT_151751 [Hyphopichia burtonii NRRL Y-1933]
MSNAYKEVGGADPQGESLIDQNDGYFIEPDNAEARNPVPSQTNHQNNSTEPEVIQPQIPIDPSKSHMFQISFYRKFFDLDSEQFFTKIQMALNPLSNSFSPTNSDNDESTELYGFIWITGTLIFLMFVSATGSNLLSGWLHSGKEAKYNYSFELLTQSITLFYGYNLLVPVLLFAFTTWILKFPERLSLTKVISIYGYTNVLWFPITIVNFLIVLFISNEKHHLILNMLEWVIVVLSGAITGLSNISKISPIVKKNTLLLAEGNTEQSNRQHITVLLALGVTHLLFTVLVKITFFGIKV